MKHEDKKIFLHPGELCFLNTAAHVHTILGSCISITLWHPELRIGGMCHFTLPKHPLLKRNLKKEESSKLDGRYADDVMKIFKREATKFGTKLIEYDAKIFGGGNMIKSEGQSVEDSIGTKNATAAMELLMAENIAIQVAHVGEFGHRRIVFDIHSGDVWVRHTEASGVRRASINGKV